MPTVDLAGEGLQRTYRETGFGGGFEPGERPAILLVTAQIDTVAPDCRADRVRGLHYVNPFDMTAKYADPLTAEVVVGHLERLRETVPG